MTAAWPEVDLGDVCEFKYGKSLPEHARSGDGFGVYGSNGEVGRHQTPLTRGATIVVGRKGSFGEVAFSEGPCWPIDTTYYVDETATKVDLRWLYYQLRTLPLTSLNRAAAVPGLNRSDAYAQRLLLPPIKEQRRIAAILDAADALRAKRRQALTKLNSLTQAVFIEMFGDPTFNPRNWPSAKLGEVLNSATYGTSKKASGSGSFPVLRMGNLTADGRIDLDDLKYVDLDLNELDRHLVCSGDVLFNRTNSADLVGKTAVYRGEEPLAYAGYLVRLRTGPQLDPEYLGIFMNLPSTKQTLRAKAKAIVGMANINAQEVQTIELPLPPIELQRRFSEARGAVASRQSYMEGQARQLDTLFASLQQRAFRGEL